jgi:hypothetical protein
MVVSALSSGGQGVSRSLDEQAERLKRILDQHPKLGIVAFELSGRVVEVVHFERQDLLKAPLCGAPVGEAVTSYCPDVTCLDCNASWAKAREDQP